MCHEINFCFLLMAFKTMPEYKLLVCLRRHSRPVWACIGISTIPCCVSWPDHDGGPPLKMSLRALATEGWRKLLQPTCFLMLSRLVFFSFDLIHFHVTTAHDQICLTH